MAFSRQNPLGSGLSIGNETQVSRRAPKGLLQGILWAFLERSL